MKVLVHTGGSEGTGPPITFLHGAGMDHTVWRFQTRRLATGRRRVVAPDLPGHGASNGKPCTSIEGWGDWLSGFLEDRDANGPVVAHSMGALIALETAGRRPDLVPSLLLVGVGIRMSVHPALMAAAHHDLPRAARYIAGWSMPAVHEGGHLEAGTWEQGAIVRLVERSRPGVLATDLAASAAYDTTHHLARLRADTLVVRGSADRMVAERATSELVDGIDGARLVILPGAGHQPMIQQPRVFNRLLDEFLDGDGKGSGR